MVRTGPLVGGKPSSELCSVVLAASDDKLCQQGQIHLRRCRHAQGGRIHLHGPQGHDHGGSQRANLLAVLKAQARQVERLQQLRAGPEELGEPRGHEALAHALLVAYAQGIQSFQPQRQASQRRHGGIGDHAAQGTLLGRLAGHYELHVLTLQLLQHPFAVPLNAVHSEDGVSSANSLLRIVQIPLRKEPIVVHKPHLQHFVVDAGHLCPETSRWPMRICRIHDSMPSQ